MHRQKVDDPTISVGGRYVVFTSEAPNLVTDDTNQQPDVFLHDRASGTTTRVSVRSDGAQASGLSGSAEISGDGATIVFDSDAGDLVDGDDQAQRPGAHAAADPPTAMAQQRRLR